MEDAQSLDRIEQIHFLGDAHDANDVVPSVKIAARGRNNRCVGRDRSEDNSYELLKVLNPENGSPLSAGIFGSCQGFTVNPEALCGRICRRSLRQPSDNDILRPVRVSAVAGKNLPL